METSPYLDEHRPEQQKLIDGIPINPNFAQILMILLIMSAIR